MAKRSKHWKCRDECQQKQEETTKASFLGDLGVIFNLFIFLGLHKTIIFHGFWGPMQFVFLVGGNFGDCIHMLGDDDKAPSKYIKNCHLEPFWGIFGTMLEPQNHHLEPLKWHFKRQISWLLDLDGINHAKKSQPGSNCPPRKVLDVSDPWFPILWVGYVRSLHYLLVFCGFSGDDICPITLQFPNYSTDLQKLNTITLPFPSFSKPISCQHDTCLLLFWFNGSSTTRTLTRNSQIRLNQQVMKIMKGRDRGRKTWVVTFNH